MNEPEVTITEGSLPDAESQFIEPPKARGWLAWCRLDGGTWNMVYPDVVAGASNDRYRHPYPMFATKEDARDVAAKNLFSCGGEIKLLRIEL